MLVRSSAPGGLASGQRHVIAFARRPLPSVTTVVGDEDVRLIPGGDDDRLGFVPGRGSAADRNVGKRQDLPPGLLQRDPGVPANRACVGGLVHEAILQRVHPCSTLEPSARTPGEGPRSARRGVGRSHGLEGDGTGEVAREPRWRSRGAAESAFRRDRRRRGGEASVPALQPTSARTARPTPATIVNRLIPGDPSTQAPMLPSIAALASDWTVPRLPTRDQLQRLPLRWRARTALRFAVLAGSCGTLAG